MKEITVDGKKFKVDGKLIPVEETQLDRIEKKLDELEEKVDKKPDYVPYVPYVPVPYPVPFPVLRYYDYYDYKTTWVAPIGGTYIGTDGSTTEATYQISQTSYNTASM